MLNVEKFKGRILKMADADYYFSIDRRNNKIKACCVSDCTECLFNSGNCAHARTKWILSEYKEPIKLTKLEYDILKYISENTKYLYITRNSCNGLFLYGMEPTKDNGYWHGKCYVGMTPFNKLFQFIQWEDEKPISIKEVLKNCAVENIEEEQ